MEDYIRAEGVSKVYRIGDTEIEAVRGIDLRIGRSDFVVVIGHSGSGKTTLVSMIGGLTRPTRGKVFIEGIDIWGLRDDKLSHFRNKKIGFIFQAFSLLPSLDVLDNVVVPLIFSNNVRKDKETVREKAVSILKNLDMGGKISSYPSELSGGEQRRVAIARSLIGDPDIILADEPTGELDVNTEREVRDIFHWINSEFEKTIVVVTHSLSWVEQAKTVIVMKDGLVEKDVVDPIKTLKGV